MSNPKKLLSLEEIYKLDLNQIKKLHSKFINSSQTKILSKFSFNKDLFVKGSGMYLYTKKGAKILDFSGGIGVLNHGHNNKNIIKERINFQKKNYIEVHKTIFSPYMVGLASNIANLLPKDISKIFFCNSGAESVEGAIKVAYKFHQSKRKYILHSDISFHGKLIATGSISGNQNKKIFPKMENTAMFEYNSTSSLKKQIKKLTKKDGTSNVYAIVLETFNNASLMQCNEEFIKNLVSICKENQIILIFDEVYTGWGKTGNLFHFMRYKQIVPDIICMSKSMGGGKSSISAFAVKNKIYKKVYENTNDAFLHTTTYNGFGEECITAIASINEIIENNYPLMAEKKGSIIMNRMKSLKKLFPDKIDHIRGIGCVNGISFKSKITNVSDKLIRLLKTLKIKNKIVKRLPAAAISDYLFNKYNIYTVITESKNEVFLNASPSLIIKEREIHYFFDSLENVLRKDIDLLMLNFASKALIN